MEQEQENIVCNITRTDFISVRNEIVNKYYDYLIEFSKQQIDDATTFEEVLTAMQKIKQKTATFGVLLSQMDLFFGDDKDAEELVCKAKKLFEEN